MAIECAHARQRSGGGKRSGALSPAAANDSPQLTVYKGAFKVAPGVSRPGSRAAVSKYRSLLAAEGRHPTALPTTSSRAQFAVARGCSDAVSGVAFLPFAHQIVSSGYSDG